MKTTQLEKLSGAQIARKVLKEWKERSLYPSFFLREIVKGESAEFMNMTMFLVYSKKFTGEFARNVKREFRRRIKKIVSAPNS